MNRNYTDETAFRDELERRFLVQEEYLGLDKPVHRANPLVSVSVPVYQHAKFIELCLDRILAQETSFPFEVIIGEDESSDGSREICMAYARKHPDRIRLFLRSRELSHITWQGKTRRLNGIWCRRSARGKYIAVCEGDDYWTDPRKLEKQARLMEAAPGTSLCFHDTEVFFDDDPSQNYRASRDWPSGEITIEPILRSWFIMTCSLFMRKSALEPTPLWHIEAANGDWLLQWILASRGSVAGLSDVMSAYRRHAGGVSNLFTQESYRLGVIWLYRNFNAWTDRRYDRLISQLIAHQEYDLAMMYREGKRLGPFFSHAWRSLHRSGMGFSNLGRARNLLLPRKISQALTGAGIKRLLRGGR